MVNRVYAGDNFQPLVDLDINKSSNIRNSPHVTWTVILTPALRWEGKNLEVPGMIEGADYSSL